MTTHVKSRCDSLKKLKTSLSFLVHHHHHNSPLLLSTSSELARQLIAIRSSSSLISTMQVRTQNLGR
jgi:hypothetical protein